jgi:cytidylate kinase
MRKEYDFSNGERGKFLRPNPKLNLPVYLDAEVLAFVQRIAKRRKTDLSSVVNQLLRGDMELVKSTQ